MQMLQVLNLCYSFKHVEEDGEKEAYKTVCFFLQQESSLKVWKKTTVIIAVLPFHPSLLCLHGQQFKIVCFFVGWLVCFCGCFHLLLMATPKLCYQLFSPIHKQAPWEKSRIFFIPYRLSCISCSIIIQGTMFTGALG